MGEKHSMAQLSACNYIARRAHAGGEFSCLLEKLAMIQNETNQLITLSLENRVKD